MNTSPKHGDQEITASKDSTNPGVDIVSPRPEESGKISSAAGDNQLDPMRASSHEQLIASSESEKQVAPDQKEILEMQQIVTAKIDALDIKEDTPVEELEKMIDQTIITIVVEHPEILNYSNELRNLNDTQKNVLNVVYAVPALVFRKAFQMREKTWT